MKLIDTGLTVDIRHRIGQAKNQCVLHDFPFLLPKIKKKSEISKILERPFKKK